VKRKTALFRLVVAGLVMVGVLLAIVLMVPDLRVLVVGQRLAYRFQSAVYPRVGLQMILRHSREVRGETNEELGLPLGEELVLELKEEIQPGQREQTIFYQCGEARTEADEVRQRGRRLSGTRLMARVLPQGGVVAAQAIEHKDELFFRSTALRPLFNSLWPPVPGGFVRPGTHWTTQLKVEVEDDTLSEPITLSFNMEYTLERFVSEAGVRAADISWKGEIIALAPAVGTGNITGACLLGTDSGSCLNGGYNLVQSFEVPLRDVPGDMKLAWREEQAARYYRLK